MHAPVQKRPNQHGPEKDSLYLYIALQLVCGTLSSVRLTCACVVQAEGTSEEPSSADGTGSSDPSQSDQSGELQTVSYHLQTPPSISHINPCAALVCVILPAETSFNQSSTSTCSPGLILNESPKDTHHLQAFVRPGLISKYNKSTHWHRK